MVITSCCRILGLTWVGDADVDDVVPDMAGSVAAQLSRPGSALEDTVDMQAVGVDGTVEAKWGVF